MNIIVHRCLLFLFTLLASSPFALSQTLRGTVRDAGTGSLMAGATLSLSIRDENIELSDWRWCTPEW
ncbi:MAG: hypothetical protein IPJ82_18110 [Lewinellaceae bacterium]|nr:hypothetical protein [Lewinellaceae bacterium]